MKVRILLVNPPIYDFAAYDFWLKPYGLLSVAGCLRGKAEFQLFDYLDRLHPFCADKRQLHCDQWQRGRFGEQRIPNPASLKTIPRYFRRFGLPRQLFQDFLQQEPSADFVLVQTMMTYWYPGVKEVIEDIRRFQPGAKIVLGGNYVTLCGRHAKSLGADLTVEGKNLEPLWRLLSLRADVEQPALWEVYPKLSTGVLKLAEGCPFNCTYCSVPKVYGKFKALSMSRSLAELELLANLGVTDIAFYDDALLYKADEVLRPFLEQVLSRDIRVNFHSPNALNARFLSRDIAQLIVAAGFQTFYLGFESASEQWQEKTGSKVCSGELGEAVENLKAAGAEPQNITAYQMLGHPDIDIQQLEESMQFVASLGIRGMLADFSPIPGTLDGDRCREYVNMSEPLLHNNTAFTIIRVGFDESNRLKDLQRTLNRQL